MYFHNRLNHKQNKTNRFNELPTNQFTLPPTLPPNVKTVPRQTNNRTQSTSQAQEIFHLHQIMIVRSLFFPD